MYSSCAVLSLRKFPFDIIPFHASVLYYWLHFSITQRILLQNMQKNYVYTSCTYLRDTFTYLANFSPTYT